MSGISHIHQDRKTCGLLISLSGIDGAGKSTLATRIQTALTHDYALICRSIWCKFGAHPLSQYRLAARLGRPNLARRIGGFGTSNRPSAAFKLYAGALLLVHLGQISLVVRGALRRGEVVICDRYIYDTMVDLNQELGWPLCRARSLLGAALIPRPDHRFLLDLPAWLAWTRKPDSASEEYLIERRAIYAALAQAEQLTIVDATQPLESVTSAVLHAITLQGFQVRLPKL